MQAEVWINLIEEMVDIKVQQHVDFDLKGNPELAKVLQAKRETDRRRLEQIKVELVRMLVG